MAPVSSAHDTPQQFSAPPPPPPGRSPFPAPGGRQPTRTGRSLRLAGIAVLVVAVVTVAGVVLALKNKDDASTTVAGTPAPGSSSAAAPAGATAAGKAGPLAVVAHRGGWEKFPRESLPAITAAAQAGDVVQFDIQFTADNVPILIREETTRTPSKTGKGSPVLCTGGPYEVARTRWSVLQAHCKTITSTSDDGRSYPIATLDQVAEAVAAEPGVWFYPEISAATASPAQTAGVLETLIRHGLLARTVVGSFYPEQLQQIRAQAAAQHLDLPVMLYLPARSGPELPKAEDLDTKDYYGVTIELKTATKSYVKALKKNLVVMAWNLNEESEWVAARDLGAEQVFTDTPDAYRKWADGTTPAATQAPVNRPATTPTPTPTPTWTPTPTGTPTSTDLVTPATAIT